MKTSCSAAWILQGMILAGLAVSACTPAAGSARLPTLTASETSPISTPTKQPNATATLTPVPTSTPTLTPSPTPVPPLLPSLFQTKLLRGNDAPHIYIQDTCRYLRQKWDPGNSPPGTVVMVIMFHSITKDRVTQSDQISVDHFEELMRALKNKGFRAINTAQLAAFLEDNAPIPPRSVVLIVDDRKRGQYFNVLFREHWEKDGWPVVNAWISVPDTPLSVWNENLLLHEEGWVDYQAHGVVHNIPVSEFSTDEFIISELAGSFTTIEQRFGRQPIAYIWPGGGFTARSVAIARSIGYRLGFTVNPRGPLMFNWVPLADEKDLNRPTYIPEGKSGDPLMVLPRYWDTDAILHIDRVIQIGEQAAEYAARSRPTELEYYDIVCKTLTGDIPAPP